MLPKVLDPDGCRGRSGPASRGLRDSMNVEETDDGDDPGRWTDQDGVVSPGSSQQ